MMLIIFLSGDFPLMVNLIKFLLLLWMESTYSTNILETLKNYRSVENHQTKIASAAFQPLSLQTDTSTYIFYLEIEVFHYWYFRFKDSVAWFSLASSRFGPSLESAYH